MDALDKIEVVADLTELDKTDFWICDHCKKPVPFINHIIVHGIIFLFGKEDGYYGTTCPTCKKTTLRKDNIKSILSLKNTISNPYNDKFLNDILRYHSIPIYPEGYPDIESHCLKTAMIPFPISTETHNRTAISLIDDYNDLTDRYITYIFGTPSVEPIMAVYEYKKESISDLLAKENESGFKIFPRHVFKDSLLSSIETLCTKYFYNPDIFFLIDVSFPGTKVTDIGIGLGQKDIDRNSNFLKILQTQPFELQDINLPLVLKAAMSPLSVPIQKIIQPIYTNREQFLKSLIDDIWNKFNNRLIQETLTHLSNLFIIEYINSAKKIDFGPVYIWNLKGKYIKKISDLDNDPKKISTIKSELSREELYLLEEDERKFPILKQIISKDHKINTLKFELPRLAGRKPDKPFMLYGETGTGKELFAKLIHEGSGRHGEFVTVDCGAIPESLFEGVFFGHKRGAFTDANSDQKGYFEQAHGGTLFLDEVENLSYQSQQKLLRVLQEREIQPFGSEHRKRIDVLIVSATNVNLRKRVEDGAFRQDLYMRLRGFMYEIPPLRKRKADIPLLVRHFIEKEDEDRLEDTNLHPFKISNGVIDLFKSHKWDGNIRDLQLLIVGIIGRRLIRADRSVITINDLPPDFFGKSGMKQEIVKQININGRREKVSNDVIRNSMMKYDNNKSKAARALGVNVKTITRRWKKVEPLLKNSPDTIPS